MTPYAIASQARNDLDAIWSYIAADSTAAADRLMDTFHEKFLLLSTQPFLGESRPDLAANLRVFCVGNYVVLYRPESPGIEVARVIHAARDVEMLTSGL